jgi:uncharacterized membrane protein YdbT with pleckstrin-like domain
MSDATAAGTQAEQTLWKGSSSQMVNFGTYLLCGLFAWLVVPIFIGLWKWIVNRCRVYEVTSQRIKITQGVWTKRTEEVELYRVQDYALVEPFWLRLFGLGNINITTTDNANPTIVIEAVPDAGALRDQIRKHVELCRDRKRVRIAEVE